ncbi:hypothetical protein P873_07850 [Arenimonas composti TR7-09 = DSM 18010]|uniref:protein-glutamate methylesterase n=1 Tax=Arenimonas composti TR7-09 = DSM 18010 TaxID=1121013 RepID=A0A091BFC9_9GAMM|nr:hypothetical protein P873_07850 [Arenimonas composti TR7-09 = DSM 18010]
MVIGASAGGVSALGALLPHLPADFPAVVLVVLHVPPERPSLLARILAPRCAMPVLEAEDKMPLVAGTIVVAPPDYHLQVDTGPAVALSVDPPVSWSRPSVDVLFETAAAVFGPDLTGIVLTGASDDGAAGLAAVVAAGGQALVQDPAEAEAATMPAAALARAAGARVLPLSGLLAALLDTRAR